MKRILIFTHGGLASGFLSAMDVIAGSHADLYAIEMKEQDSFETKEKEIRAFLNEAHEDDHIFILTDIPVGSTTKCAIPFLEYTKNLYIISGLNLSLLLAIVLEPLEEHVTERIRSLMEQSKETIVFINDFMKEGEEE